MNKKRYENLPADLRKALDANSGIQLSRQLGQAFLDADQPGRDLIVKESGKIHPRQPSRQYAFIELVACRRADVKKF